jgi:uncharacterized protein
VGRDVVCISHTSGAGGEEIGRVVAERLGFLYADEEVITRAAERSGIDPDAVADEERRKSFFANLMETMAYGGSVTGAPPIATDEVPSESVRGFIREAIREIAEHGKAVIVAHAASYAVSADERQLRVLVTAPRDTRAKRVAQAEGLSDLEAVRVLKRSDAGRVDYLKRFYGVGEELPIHYDLVVNTESLSPEQAAELVVRAAGGA